MYELLLGPVLPKFESVPNELCFQLSSSNLNLKKN
jgi:hypothetical protein